MTTMAGISKYRKARGLTMEELSRRSGVGESHLYRLLSGESKNPTLATLTKLAQALEIPPELLIAGPESRSA